MMTIPEQDSTARTNFASNRIMILKAARLEKLLV